MTVAESGRDRLDFPSPSALCSQVPREHQMSPEDCLRTYLWRTVTKRRMHMGLSSHSHPSCQVQCGVSGSIQLARGDVHSLYSFGATAGAPLSVQGRSLRLGWRHRLEHVPTKQSMLYNGNPVVLKQGAIPNQRQTMRRPANAGCFMQRPFATVLATLVS